MQNRTPKNIIKQNIGGLCYTGVQEFVCKSCRGFDFHTGERNIQISLFWQRGKVFSVIQRNALRYRQKVWKGNILWEESSCPCLCFLLPFLSSRLKQHEIREWTHFFTICEKISLLYFFLFKKMTRKIYYNMNI